LSSKPSLSDPATPETSSRTPLVALVGNPNAGKTTLFNALTGSHQKVGNYPGVTVEKVSGSLRLSNRSVECIDVPGLYSLNPVSEDERVAAEAISGGGTFPRPDLLVCVVDATNLERNLFFFSQLAEAGYPMIVALTMVDRLTANKASIDLVRLSNLLGVDVVPVKGHKGGQLQELREAIERNLEEPRKPSIDVMLPDAVEARVAALRERLARTGLDVSKKDVRRMLLQPSNEFENTPELEEAFREAREKTQAEGHPSNSTLEVASRYQWAGMVQRAAVRESEAPRRSRTDRIDQILTHRVFGLGIFVALMYGVFLSIYTFATPFMDWIEGQFGALGQFIGPRLEGTPMLQSLVVDGIIAGVGGVLVFLPQILILFFFISVLEGSGYLARAAFLMDRLLGWCGLNGRAFIPLLSSFACAIPGIMAARVMPDPKSRLATILVAPLMSCSARLPVYAVLIGAFIEPKYGAFWAGFALFAMHFLGLFMAIPITWVLNRKVLKGRRLPFLLELPPYQWPRVRDVWLSMYFRGKVFLKTAGTIIFFMSVVIWALGYFPRVDDAGKDRIAASVKLENPQAEQEEIDKRVDEFQLEQSYLGRTGKAIEPVFLPAGFDWRISTAILAAFPAREVVVPSLGILFNLGGDVDTEAPDLKNAIHAAKWPDGRPLFTVWTAAGLMAFFALCAQCMATLATVKRETNSWKWPVFMFVYMTGLAYLVAVLINQIGLLVGK
jgi:ferrous iron transport protein B